MNLSSSSEKENLYKKRVTVLKETFQFVDAILIEDPIDLYYLTGLSFSVGQLWIGKKEVLLLVDSRYIAGAEEKSPFPVALKSLAKISDFILRNQVSSLGFDGAKTFFERVEELKRDFSSLFFKPLSLVTKELRKIKEPEEILFTRQSASILWDGYLYIKTLLRKGISEKEVARQFEIFCLQKGADALSFEPIIAFGENSALPHYRAGEKKLEEGHVVLIDIGVIFKGYASDMTRVLFFKKEDPLLSRWLDIIIRAKDCAFSICRPGTLFKDLDVAVRSVLKQENVEEYFIHSLGHGIGLEVHEPPKIRFDQDEGVLKPGMIFTLEPGLYLPGRGGVRYEDMIIVTEKGAENLFPFDKAVL